MITRAKPLSFSLSSLRHHSIAVVRVLSRIFSALANSNIFFLIAVFLFYGSVPGIIGRALSGFAGIRLRPPFA
jgi:hypothetical protein